MLILQLLWEFCIPDLPSFSYVIQLGEVGRTDSDDIIGDAYVRVRFYRAACNAEAV